MQSAQCRVHICHGHRHDLSRLCHGLNRKSRSVKPTLSQRHGSSEGYCSSSSSSSNNCPITGSKRSSCQVKGQSLSTNVVPDFFQDPVRFYRAMQRTVIPEQRPEASAPPPPAGTHVRFPRESGRQLLNPVPKGSQDLLQVVAPNCASLHIKLFFPAHSQLSTRKS